ncbi:uncharacterized protein LOC132274882 isoform X2 [Cornus florida]|uniref:uncharacterized protein LOC132274882 isoform X2 n=1 Tax=Cornus florida TaxID=4283 RepID=UPI00289CB98C|nr:uncharacterized protein LOC132274882 isoform X2 [Cornus florida]
MYLGSLLKLQVNWNMDYTKIDVNGRDCIEKEADSSVTGHSGNTNSSDERVRHRLRDGGKVVIGNGHRRSLASSPPNEKTKSHNECTVSALSSSSSKNAHLFSGTVAHKTVRYNDKDRFHSQHNGKGKALCISQSSACQEDRPVVDLMQQKRHAQEFEQVFPRGALRNSQVEETRKVLISTNRFSSLNGMGCPSTASGSDRKGKGEEKVVDACKGDSGFARGKGINFVSDSQPNAGKLMSASINSISSHRVTGRKRSVRSGCESPHDIVKAKQIAEKRNNCRIDLEHNDSWIVASNCPHRVKGKGVMDHHFLAKEPRTKTTHLSTRDNEKANRISDVTRDAFGCFDGLGGWRSMHNRMKKTTLPLSDEDWRLSRRKDDYSFVHQHHKKRVLRKNDGDGVSNNTVNDSAKDWDQDLFQHKSASPVAETISHIMSQLDEFDAQCHAAISLMEKKKPSSTSSNHVQCSTSGSANQPHENSLLRKNNEDGICNRIGHDSPKDWDAACQHGSTATVAQTASRIMSYLDQFDECCDAAISLMERNKAGSTSGNRGESSRAGFDDPQITYLGANIIQNHQRLGISDPVGIRNIASRSIGCSRNDDSDGRARQVESDEMLARELQEQFYYEVPEFAELQEDSWHAFYSGSRHVSHRLQGINIVDALEAFTSRVADNLLPVQRVSNQHYETLLALDENNRYVGASIDQINELPQTTVQTDGFEEPCAICLETPTTGDIIRHLPCLHKFHKDCIDPWLGIRTSCPVCKSSII